MWLVWTAAGLILAGFAFFGSSTRVHQENLTLTVTTPSGPVSASAVTEVSATSEYGLIYQLFKGLTGGSTGSTSVDGTAIMLEVTPGRWLFVLRSQPNGSIYPLSSTGFYDPSKGISLKNRRDGSLREALLGSDIGLEIDLPRHIWPAFVTFADPGVPGTISMVDPENLSATFGPGIEFERLTISRSDGAPDMGPLIALLPWLCTERPFPLPEIVLSWTAGQRLLYNLTHPQNFISRVCPPS